MLELPDNWERVPWRGNDGGTATLSGYLPGYYGLLSAWLVRPNLLRNLPSKFFCTPKEGHFEQTSLPTIRQVKEFTPLFNFGVCRYQCTSPRLRILAPWSSPNKYNIHSGLIVLHLLEPDT